MGSYLSLGRTAEKFRMCQRNAALLVFRALVALNYSYNSCYCVKDISHIVEAMPLRDLVSRVRCFPIICARLVMAPISNKRRCFWDAGLYGLPLSSTEDYGSAEVKSRCRFQCLQRQSLSSSGNTCRNSITASNQRQERFMVSNMCVS